MRLGNRISEVYNNSLHFDDVFIIPKYSKIKTRKEVDVGVKFPSNSIKIPVMCANMETVVNANLANVFTKNGAIPALHRFQSIEDAVKEFQIVNSNAPFHEYPIFVSVGVNRDSHDRAKELYKNGAKYFVIDIAHGHSENMKNMIEWMRKEFNDDIFIMAGNVATGEATLDLINWGADSIKSGVGPGSVCLTKDVTGVTVPTVSSITSCSTAVKKAEQKHGRKFYLVADGGCKTIGDISKALGCGADLVMSGRFFAGCDESPEGNRYRGSASQDVQVKYRTDQHLNMPTPEGTTEELPNSGPVEQVLNLIAGGLRSAFSYVDAKNMNEFHDRCEFGIRFNK